MKKFFDLFKRNKHEAEIEEEGKQALSNAFGRMFDYASRQQGPYRIDNDIWYS